MRVIAGSAKGRKLKSSLKYALRPTSDRVREALFDILGLRVQKVHFLDLFAGTGSVGIEALSRGAKQATFVEKKASYAELIRRNVELCGFTNFEIIVYDVLRAIVSLHNRQRKFGLIFIDPPYRSDLALKTLQALDATDLLDQEHSIIVEHSIKNPLPARIGNLIVERVSEFGDTLLTFYRREEEKAEKEEEPKEERPKE
ncbi:MAG: 16S rRNA (guanine(966)-N(2))-methyltransferase RsmD [bacterium]|nr:16S rRNA (guanine(966)-N(2))-methyltransferase RsmD [bacterium]